jgi:hypothetical protein
MGHVGSLLLAVEETRDELVRLEAEPASALTGKRGVLLQPVHRLLELVVALRTLDGHRVASVGLHFHHSFPLPDTTPSAWGATVTIRAGQKVTSPLGRRLGPRSRDRTPAHAPRTACASLQTERCTLLLDRPDVVLQMVNRMEQQLAQGHEAVLALHRDALPRVRRKRA